MAGGRRDGELEGQPSLQEMLPCGVAGKAKDSELRGRTVLRGENRDVCDEAPAQRILHISFKLASYPQGIIIENETQK